MYFVLSVYLLCCVMYSLCVPRAKKKIFTIVGHMSTLSYPCVTGMHTGYVMDVKDAIDVRTIHYIYYI